MKKNMTKFLRVLATNIVSLSPWPFYICTYLLTLIAIGVLVLHGSNNEEYYLYFALSLFFLVTLCFIFIVYKRIPLQLKCITINVKIRVLKAKSFYMQKLTIENLCILIIKRLLIYTMFFFIYLIFYQCGIGIYFGQIKLILYLLLLILLIRKIYRDYKIYKHNLVFDAIVLIKLLCSMVCFFIFNPLGTIKFYNSLLEDNHNFISDDRLEQGWLGEGEVSDNENVSANSNPEPDNNSNNNGSDNQAGYVNDIPLKDLPYDEQVKAIKDKDIFEQIGLIEEKGLDEERHRSRLIELVEHRLVDYLNSTEISNDPNKRANIESYIHDREGALQTLNDIAMFGGNTAVDILEAKALGGEEGEKKVQELTKAGMDYLYGEEETNEDPPRDEP